MMNLNGGTPSPTQAPSRSQADPGLGIGPGSAEEAAGCGEADAIRGNPTADLVVETTKEQ